MTTADIEDPIDKTQWLPDGEPIITPERASKDDIAIERECFDCKGTGKLDFRRCRLCRGRGRVLDARWEKGEIDAGDIRYAQAIVRNVMNHLYERGVLTAQHVHDGQTYEAWQSYFTASLRHRNNPIYSPELERVKRVVIDDGLFDGDYERLIRSLTTTQKRIIDFSINAIAREHQRWLVKGHEEHYRKAFDRLSELMQQLREEWEERQKENACANV
jgi:hypothetical protein